MAGEIAYTKLMCNELELINAIVIPYSASMRNRPGTPDRIIVHAYWMGFLEFKGEKTPIKKNQELTIKEMNKRQPGCAFIVRKPGVVEDHIGNWLGSFKTAKELIVLLVELKKSMN